MAEPYYQDGSVTIYHGDCRDILPQLSADVLVTDPPYGVNLGNHGGANDGRRDHVLVKAGYQSYEDTPENFDAVVVPAIRLALARTDGRGVVFCAGHMAWRLPEPAALGGIFLPAACGRTAWGYNSFAHALLYGKAPDLHLGAKPIGIASTATSDNWGHPVEKPIRWMRWAVALASRDRETVLDPFAGSGTTLRAAKDLGRKAIGIEIEERYCEIAARKMGQEVLDVA
jgi:site-specific DNA-methyltransferase (adenine-specific)